MSTRGTKNDHSITVTVYDHEYNGIPITFYITDYTTRMIGSGAAVTRYIVEDIAEDMFTGKESITYSSYAISSIPEYFCVNDQWSAYTISSIPEYFCVNDQWYSSLTGPDDINKHIDEPEAAHDILYKESLQDVVRTLIDNIPDMVHGVEQINTLPVYIKFNDIIQTMHVKDISYVESTFGMIFVFLTGAGPVEIGRIINSNSTVSLDKQNWYKLETVGQVKTFCSDAHVLLTMKQLQESQE